MIDATFIPASIEVEISTTGATITPEAQIIHDFRVPSVYQDPVTKVVTIL